MYREDCVFCQVLAGELPGNFAYQDDDVAVFWDINPQAPTHLLIVPKKHITNISEFDEEDNHLLCKMILTAKKIAHQMGLSKKGFRLVMNEGKDSGQTIFHVHIHLLSGRRLMWPPG